MIKDIFSVVKFNDHSDFHQEYLNRRKNHKDDLYTPEVIREIVAKHGAMLLGTVIEKNDDYMIVGSNKILFKVSNETLNFKDIKVNNGDKVVLESAKIYQSINDGKYQAITVRWIHKVIH